MVTEDECITYYENLAKVHKVIQHEVGGQKSFFEIEDLESLDNFDEALRNVVGSTVMLLYASDGELNDNDTENHNQELDCQIYILQRKTNAVAVSQIRSACIEIIKEVLGRTKREARQGLVFPGKIVQFRINKIPVRKVGPMCLDWFGYTALLTFTCPFGYTVDSGSWTDIP